MRHRPIQAAPRERVPFTLWGPKRVRQTLATVAAAAAGLVPVVFIGSPAYAVAADNLTVADASTWEGGTISFTFKYTGSAPATFDLTTSGTAAGGGALSGSVDFVNTNLGPDPALDFPASSATSPSTQTITLLTGADADAVDETFTLTATNTGSNALSNGPGDSSSKSATGTIYAAPSTAATVSLSSVPNPVAESAGSVNVVASLSSVLSHDVTIPVSTGSSSRTDATEDAVSTGGVTRDYTALAAGTSITIPAGQLTGSVPVSINDDTVDEADTQYFRVTSASYSPATVVSNTSYIDVGITDNDAAPTVSIGDAPATTENSPATFPIKLSGLSEKTLKVNFSTQSGIDTATTRGATSGSDFTGQTNSLVTIAPLTQTVYQTVTTSTDTALEGTEAFTASINTAPSPFTVALGSPTTAVGTITDAATLPPLAVTAGTTQNVQETDTGTTDRTTAVTVDLTGIMTVETPLKLDYKFVDGTATNGVDYKGTNGTLTIPTSAANTVWSGSIPWTSVGDTVYEGTETFAINFASSNNSVLASTLTSQATTISLIETAEADSKPTWTVGDVTLKEGDTGTTTARVPITLSGKASGDVAFTAAFAGSPSATEGGVNAGDTAGANDFDYPSSLTVTVPAGSKTGYLEFPINGDTVFERDETLGIDITTASTLTTNTLSSDVSHSSRVTITNDDAAPSFMFNPSSGSEGTTLRISGKVTGVSQYAYDVSFATAAAMGADAATPVTDFDVPATIASLHVARGETGTTFVDVTPPLTDIADIYLMPDTIDEMTEAFNVTATESSTSPIGFQTSTGVYKINDDPGDLPPAVSLRGATVNEDQASVDVPVDLEPNGDATSTTQTITIPWWTENGSAREGEDFLSMGGDLVIKPGDTSPVINIKILNDTLKEPDETFKVMLGHPKSPTGATVDKADAVVTIRDDNDVIAPVMPSLMLTGPSKGAGSVTAWGTATPGTMVELHGAPMPETDKKDLKVLASVKADHAGNYKFSARAITQGWAFYVQTGAWSTSVKLVKLTQSPSLTLSTTKGKLAVMVWGNPKASGQKVTVQRWSGGKWVAIATGKTTGAGYKGSWKFSSGSKQTVRVMVDGNIAAGISGGWSSSKSITIK